MSTLQKLLLLVILFFNFSLYAQYVDTTCGTGNIDIEERVARPELANKIFTENFIIHWEPPTTFTYALKVANFAEESFEKQCISEEFFFVKWTIPPADNGQNGNNSNPDDRYDIYIQSESQVQSKGVTIADPPEEWEEEWSPSFFKVSNNMNDDDLIITVAHEFNHACQMADSYIDIYNGSLWFAENTATWVAEVIYNYQYKFYLRFFSADANPLNLPYARITSTDNYKFGGFLWPRFLAEWKNDNNIISKIWKRMGETQGQQTLTDII